MTDACTRLATRFEEMRADGLVDVRFLFVNTDDYTQEMMCTDALELLDSYESGEGVVLEVPALDRR